MDNQTRDLLRAAVGALQDAATIVCHLETRLAEVEGERGSLGPERLLTPVQVSELLAISERKVREMICRGDLPSVRVGEANIRVPSSAYRAYVERLSEDRRKELK